MSGKLLTTGQAARLCSVTSDTFLKWIKQGRVKARRTAGGHYRIARADVRHLVGRAVHHSLSDPSCVRRRHFKYCWEYYSVDNGPPPECSECLVYRTRAYRCYEVLKLAEASGHALTFCKQRCEDCDYYWQVHAQATNVLFISDDLTLASALKQEATQADFNLAFTDCEYACSALVESYRPDFAVVDCSLGPERSQDMVRHLIVDPRIPYVKVILAAEVDQFPESCKKDVFARIEKPIRIEDIRACIHGV